jgi:hypothetical protein
MGTFMGHFEKTESYIQGLNITEADPLDQKVSELLGDDILYERASQALRRRFVRGAIKVEGMDRNHRLTRIKREKVGGKYAYYIQGEDGNWNEPEERIWIVAMYGLWQENKSKT